MESDRFDYLVRSLVATGSRRRAIISAIMGAGSLLGVVDVIAGDNKNNKNKNNKNKKKDKKDEKKPKCKPLVEEPCGDHCCDALYRPCCKGLCCDFEWTCCQNKICCPPKWACCGTAEAPECKPPCSSGVPCGCGCCETGETCCETTGTTGEMPYNYCCGPGLTCKKSTNNTCVKA